MLKSSDNRAETDVMATAHATVSRETIDAARTGDRDALAMLWRTYQPQILRFLRARRAPVPEDVASEVWVDVGRALDRFEGDGTDFQRWLFTIARRRSIDEVRRMERRRESPDLDRDRGRFERIADARRVDEEGTLDDAIALLEALSPHMAEAVMLRVVYDLPVSDVAEVMDRTEGSVRVLVHRGLIRLRETMTVESEPTESVAS